MSPERPTREINEKPPDSEEPTTKEVVENKAICASFLDLQTSDYKINEQILAKAQHDDQAILAETEIKLYIVAHRLVKFNNK